MVKKNKTDEIRNNVIKQLNHKLVNLSFTKDDVQKIVNDTFGTNVKIEWNCYEDGGLVCYDAMFSTDEMFLADGAKVDDALVGDFDLYWFPCKQPNNLGTEVYIVEIGADFH